MTRQNTGKQPTTSDTPGDRLWKRRSAIPLDLRRHPNWVAWEYGPVRANGTQPKYPIDPATGRSASVSDPNTWRGFVVALDRCLRSDLDGVGVVLTGGDQLVGIDLDHCLNPQTGKLTEKVEQIVRALDSYSEASPSGTGVRIFVYGAIPKAIKKEWIEIYDRDHFLTVTGNHLPNTSCEIRDGGAALARLYRQASGTNRKAEVASESAPRRTNSNEAYERILDACDNREEAAKFQSLWRGERAGYPSASEADCSFCVLLAKHTGFEGIAVDRMFRQSRRFRPKWDEPHSANGQTYGDMTIETAIEFALDSFKKKYAVRSATDPEPSTPDADDDLMAGLFARNSLGNISGFSGIGKSPLLYQMGLCVASGKPFLNHKTSRGRVLYLDYENSTNQSGELVRSISAHLGLREKLSEFLYWNLASASDQWGKTGGHSALDMIRDLKPNLVIIDSLTAYCPKIEDKNSEATARYKEFRGIIRECDTAILCSHHLRKPPHKNGTRPESLEQGNVRRWFEQARGASALINACDVRIGLEESTRAARISTNGELEIALLMRGYARVRGEIPPIHLARVFDKNGDPLGYRNLTGSQLLFNPEQQSTFTQLPATFRFKRAQQAYGKGPQATSDLLKKCIALNILRKVGNQYQKVREEA